MTDTWIPSVVPNTTIKSSWGNTIRDHTVLVFNTVAERTSHLPTPKKGQTCWVQELGRIEVFNGVQWFPVSTVASYTNETERAAGLANPVLGVMTWLTRPLESPIPRLEVFNGSTWTAIQTGRTGLKGNWALDYVAWGNWTLVYQWWQVEGSQLTIAGRLSYTSAGAVPGAPPFQRLIVRLLDAENHPAPATTLEGKQFSVGAAWVEQAASAGMSRMAATVKCEVLNDDERSKNQYELRFGTGAGSWTATSPVTLVSGDVLDFLVGNIPVYPG